MWLDLRGCQLRLVFCSFGFFSEFIAEHCRCVSGGAPGHGPAAARRWSDLGAHSDVFCLCVADVAGVAGKLPVAGAIAESVCPFRRRAKSAKPDSSERLRSLAETKAMRVRPDRYRYSCELHL